jgi:hypothetical protein
MPTPIDFLRLILPPVGPYAYLVKPAGRTKPQNEFAPTIEALWQQMAAWDARGAETWHACASFKRAENDPRGTKQADKRLGRTHHNVALLKTLRLDLDAGNGKPYQDAAAAGAQAVAFASAAQLPMPMLVASGGGAHVYWPLHEAIMPSQWKVLANKLKLLCRQHNLQADPAVTADVTRVLRTPGTHSQKRGGKLVRCFQLVKPYDLNDFVGLNVDIAQLAQVPVKVDVRVPEYLRIAGLPRLADRAAEGMRGKDVFAEEIAGQCGQLAAFRDSRGEVPEPLWYAALGVLAWCADGDEAGHAWSKDYDGYTPEETQTKLDRARELSGATLCERFHGLAPAACEACPLWGKVNSPIGAMRGVVKVDRPESGETLNGHDALPPMFADASPQTEFIRFPDVDGKGTILKTCRNARAAIKALGVTCEYDTFHNKMLLGGQPINQYAGELSDEATQMLRVMIGEQFNFDPGQPNTHDAAVQECLQHAYDPILDYLNEVQWDGRPRLGTWLADYLGADRSPLNAEIGTLCLVAAVRRARVPGAKFDQITVLEGREGTKKSGAIEILAGSENFSDQTILGLDDKAQQEMVQGVWLYEIADLAGITKAEVERVKAFASRKVDRARPAYGRSRVDRPRRCVFFATTNNDTYLKSQTGNRRFWPVRAPRVNLDALTRDRDQLWAQAAYIERSGASVFLREAMWGEVGALQDSRRDHDPWDDILRHVKGALNTEQTEYRISTRDIFELWLRVGGDKLTDTSAKRLCYTMTRLGWNGPKALRINDEVVRGYSRPSNSDEHVTLHEGETP